MWNNGHYARIKELHKFLLNNYTQRIQINNVHLNSIVLSSSIWINIEFKYEIILICVQKRWICVRKWKKILNFYSVMQNVSFWSLEWLLFPVADDSSLGKQVRNFRFIFTSRFARGKNKQKIPKSPRTNTPGERKGFAKQSLERSHLIIGWGDVPWLYAAQFHPIFVMYAN